MNEEELKKKCAEYADELGALNEKHGVTGIICHNWDNEDMGYMRVYKMINDCDDDDQENGCFNFVIGFSASGKELFPHCDPRTGRCGK